MLIIVIVYQLQINFLLLCQVNYFIFKAVVYQLQINLYQIKDLIFEVKVEMILEINYFMAMWFIIMLIMVELIIIIIIIIIMTIIIIIIEDLKQVMSINFVFIITINFMIGVAMMLKLRKIIRLINFPITAQIIKIKVDLQINLKFIIDFNSQITLNLIMAIMAIIDCY